MLELQEIAVPGLGVHGAEDKNDALLQACPINLYGAASHDSVKPPHGIVGTRHWFDWAKARHAVAETQFWDACCARAEAALTTCLEDPKQPT
jgi:hypothetical protein